MKRILTVDEEPHITTPIKLTLNKEEFSVDSAHSVREALKLLEKNKYDCILSEIIMQGIDGYEFCACVRGNPKTKKIPFIFLTIKTKATDRLDAIDMGADDYIQKPFDPLELERRIRLNICGE